MPLHPEPFRSLLAAGRPAQAAELPARAPEELLARAQARLQVGREREARADLEACLPALGDRARVELCYLDIRSRGDLDQARLALCTIVEAAGAGSELAGRAWHLLGLAEGKLRRSEAAVAALLKAAECYRELGLQAELAQVHDTLGSVFAAQGRLDYATGHYALALVSKTRAGDRYGLAITLGNLGRTYLRSGRCAEALDAFALDLEIARELGDLRGQARMHEDLGRARMALGDAARAETALRECLRLAAEQGFLDLEFFARKDLALLLARAGRHAEASAELDLAGQALGTSGEPYLQIVLLSARGQCLRAAGDPQALELLEQASERFATADLPDHEIPVLLTLASELAARGRRREAEESLRRATRRARRDGYARYLPQIREEMARLCLVEPLAEEQGRALGAGAHAAGDAAAPSDGYVLIDKLGEGGFGEVFKAYDPQRGEVVAFKRIDLSRLYDPGARRRLLESARRELDAVSRLRHPGIARVHALGTDPEGRVYVVQELITGGSLRQRIPRGPTADVIEVVETLGLVCQALVELHAAGIVHRDLKPENILLREPSLAPVLIDFGIAYVPDKEVDERFVAGTIAYMAPEQAAGRQVTSEADMYSLGVILYEWLTGLRPIKPRSVEMSGLAGELATKKPTPIAEWRPDVPFEIRELLDSLLAKDPNDRVGAEHVAEFCELLAKELRRKR